MFVRLLVAVSLFLISATLLSAETPPQKEIAKKETSTKPTKEDTEKQKIEKKVKNLLKEELTLNNVDGTIPLKKKHLSVSACREEVCLAIIQTTDAAGFVFYEMLSVDVKRGTKELINKKYAMYDLVFIQTANLEKTKEPDMLYTFLDCVECEPAVTMTALYFDPGKRIWKERDGEKGSQSLKGILVGRIDPINIYSCYMYVGDTTKDGLNDVATWCYVFLDEENAKAREEITVYFLKNGVWENKKITDHRESTAIKDLMCKKTKEKKETNEYLKCN